MRTLRLITRASALAAVVLFAGAQATRAQTADQTKTAAPA